MYSTLTLFEMITIFIEDTTLSLIIFLDATRSQDCLQVTSHLLYLDSAEINNPKMGIRLRETRPTAQFFHRFFTSQLQRLVYTAQRNHRRRRQSQRHPRRTSLLQTATITPENKKLASRDPPELQAARSRSLPLTTIESCSAARRSALGGGARRIGEPPPGSSARACAWMRAWPGWRIGSRRLLLVGSYSSSLPIVGKMQAITRTTKFSRPSSSTLTKTYTAAWPRWQLSTVAGCRARCGGNSVFAHLDMTSERVLSIPGRCVALKAIFSATHHFKIFSLTRDNVSKRPPCRLRYAQTTTESVRTSSDLPLSHFTNV
eukprot:COSAG05_NODE_2109_length_3549_cov_3.498261_2_plen_317_part_00